MKISQNGLNIIKSHEGLASKIPNVDFFKSTHKLSQVLLSQSDIENNITIYPYKCSAGVLTIGWGHTKTTSKYINGCTFNKCEELLKSDLAVFENAINNDSDIAKAINENQNKFDALICLAFNIGCSAFAKSTVRKCIINKESQDKISQAWQMWNKAGGKENEGLKKRRLKELELFFATENTSQNTSQSSSFFSMDWTSSIVDTLKNKGFDLIKDKGIDYISSLIPGGTIFKDIAKSLLGNENASEKEVVHAINNTDPSKLQEILAQHNIEIEKTKQEEERTKQSDNTIINKSLGIIQHLFTKDNIKYAIGFTIFFYVTSFLNIYLIQKYIDDKAIGDAWQQVVLSIMVIYPMILPALLFKPIYNFISIVLNAVANRIAKAIN